MYKGKDYYFVRPLFIIMLAGSPKYHGIEFPIKKLDFVILILLCF